MRCKSRRVALLAALVVHTSAYAYVTNPYSFISRRRPQNQNVFRRGAVMPSNVLNRGRRKQCALQMVLNTPESIIEKASTEKLLDELIDESTRLSARRPIMLQFDPTGIQIWRRWRGTIFAETWQACVRNMLIAMVVALFYKRFPQYKTRLQGFSILWGQLLSVTTFTLTFFVNQSYALWRKCYELSRRLQGRLNDLGLTLAAHASRTAPEDPDTPSTYTPAAKNVLLLVGRYIRLFNLLTYASFTRSHRPILTPSGMRRLVERGLMTPEEKDALTKADVAATQRHNAVVLWIVSVFNEARRAGHIVGGPGFEQQFMEKVHVIRAQYGAIGDELQGRMTLAYAHIVQVLVDTILWMYPFMAFSSNMSPAIGIVGCGLLTIFYQGLFDLAKQFLDPYDNENYGKGHDPLCVDTLIAETNAGSIRWMNGFEFQPWSSEAIRSGDMDSLYRPTRGFSVKDLEAKEEAAELEKLEEEEEEEVALNEEANTSNAMEIIESVEIVATEVDDESPFLSQARKGMLDLSTLVSEIVVNSSENNGANADVSKERINAVTEEDVIVSEGAILEHIVEESNSSSEEDFQEETSEEEVLPHVEAKETDEEEIMIEEKGKDSIGPVTVEDYVKETAEIIAAAEREAMETEAIMNAPPGADSVEGLNNDDDEDEEDDQDLDKIGHTVVDVKEVPPKLEIDTAEVYEAAKERMLKDIVDDADFEVSRDELSKKAEEIIEAAEGELLETQAILNASPGADSVDICDSDDTDCINELGSTSPLDVLPSAELDLAADIMAGELKERIVQNSFSDLEVLEMDKKDSMN